MRTSKTLSGLIFGFALIAAFPASSPAQSIEKVWNTRETFRLGPAATSVDLDGNGNLEILVIDGQARRLAVIDADNGHSVWSAEFPLAGEIGHPAITGQFVGDGSIDIVLVSSGGTLICVDGHTGELLGLRELDAGPAAPLTMIPLQASGPVEQYREGAAMLDKEGKLHVFEFGASQTPNTKFSLDLGTSSDNAPMLADLGDAFPQPALVLLSEQGKLTITSVDDGASAKAQSYSLLRNRVFKTFLGAGDVNGDGSDDLAVADDRGWLNAFTVTGDRLVPIWPAVSIGREPTSPPVLIDVNRDHHQEILIHQETELSLVNGTTGKIDLWEVSSGRYIHDVPIASPPAVFEISEGPAVAAFGDLSGRVWVLDLSRGEILQDSNGRPYSFEAGTSHAPRTTLLAGPIRSSARTDLFVLGSRSGEGILLDAGLPWPTGNPPWAGHLGGSWRLGSTPERYSLRSERSADAADAHKLAALRSARQAFDEKRWEDALELADRALAIHPLDEEAYQLRQKIQGRMSRGRRTLTLLALLAALGVVIAVGARPSIRMLRRYLAQAALKKGRNQEALAHYRAIYRSSPDNRRNLKDLADLLVEIKDYERASVTVFEEACEAFPNDDRYAKALAYTFSAQGRRDERAAQAYEGMTRVVSHPGPWAFTLGQTYEGLGEDEKALEAYHLAVRHGFKSPDLDEALASLYVRLNWREPEILPLLRNVASRHMNDAPFLETLCKCALRAREFDDQVRQAADRLLELDPESLAAHQVLATRLLHEGNVNEALRHAEVLKNMESDHPQVQQLLAECYAADGRTSEDARKLYETSLRANPNSQSIQVALAVIYAMEGRSDEVSRNLYLQAVLQDKGSLDFLSSIGGLALKTRDTKLLVAAGERLREHSTLTPEMTRALAKAYVDREEVGEKVQQVLEEAVQHAPEDAALALELARFYIEDDRTDADAIKIYEAACAIEPKPMEVVHQLIRAYSDSQVSEQALVLAREFLKTHPDDTTLVKLAASASASLDHLDEAIEQFESIYQRDPADTEALVQLALLYRRKELNDDKAMAVYGKAIEAEPQNIDLHDALARGQASRKDWDSVVSTIKHFLTAAPKQIDAAIQLMQGLASGGAEVNGLRWFLVETLILRARFSQALEQIARIVKTDSGQTEQALASFEKILDRAPEQPDVHHQRGTLLLELGKVSEARQALERAHRLQPENEALIKDLADSYEKLLETRDSMEVRFKLGNLAMRLARYDLAISCFQRTDKDDRWAAESNLALGRCFLAKGMLDLALQELKKGEVGDETKSLLYDLGRAYEAAGDPRGAREAYKSIYAVDISYKDIKSRMDALLNAVTDPNSPERTAIISSLSEEAKSRYDLIQELGRGAMGIVYKARDNELEEIVALKILPESLERNQNALKMFRQEARNARRLAHAGIVRIHDIGEERGRKYISMEFVDGIDLKQRLIEAKRNLPLHEVLNYMRQICEAMVAAHEAHIVHRDLKPANIMITKQKRVKVTDFGIAKLVRDETTRAQTKSRTIVGTPLYMSPEQVKGGAIDHRADIYSMGILFYEMVTGRPPFIEGDLAYHHVSTPPMPLPDDVPAELAELIMKCLEKKADDRWQSVSEMVRHLKKVQLPDSDDTVA